MQYTDNRYHLRVEFDTRGTGILHDELTRMQQSLTPVGEAVQDFPHSDLTVTVVRHPRSQTYHVEMRLKLPEGTVFTGDRDAYLDTAFQRCVRKLARKVQAFTDRRDRGVEEALERRQSLEDDVVMPEDPEAGPLGEAVRRGDYRAFRNLLPGYEDWLRKRAGRWLQRYPEAESRVGHGLAIGDLVEEIYLNAFERFPQKPADVSFRAWLEGIIDPSLKALLRHPDEEAENASLARTVREMPAGQV
jgi:hypothetical protein